MGGQFAEIFSLLWIELEDEDMPVSTLSTRYSICVQISTQLM